MLISGCIIMLYDICISLYRQMFIRCCWLIGYCYLQLRYLVVLWGCIYTNKERVRLRVPPWVWSIFCAGRMSTLARVRTHFQFTEAPFRGTGSLIYRQIASWAKPAGACCGPPAEGQRARSSVKSTTQFFQTNPLLNPWAGCARTPRAFSVLV